MLTKARIIRWMTYGGSTRNMTKRYKSLAGKYEELRPCRRCKYNIKMQLKKRLKTLIRLAGFVK